MQLLACHNGRLLRTTLSLPADDLGAPANTLKPRPAFKTHLPALDALAPGAAFARGAVHEILADPAHPPPKFFAALLARAALAANGDARRNVNVELAGAGGAVVWCDPD